MGFDGCDGNKGGSDGLRVTQMCRGALMETSVGRDPLMSDGDTNVWGD